LKIVANPPNKMIHEFKGYYQADVDSVKEGLALKNTLWTNTIVAS
jgi:hypothetical protein